ncbi:hypothetical protein KQI52_05565 [bacterium]|nr:hypothetical protein [bacterium]
MMREFSWKTCLWPEDKHPMPLCRHVWERHLRAENDGELPVSSDVLDKQWDMIIAMQGNEDCPCARELDTLSRGVSSPD